MYQNNSDQYGQSGLNHVLILFAAAVVEPCELPNEGEVVQCQKMAGRNTFVDLYNKATDPRCRIKKSQDIWQVIENGEKFEGVVHGFQKSIKYFEEIRKIDPKMFVGQNVARKTPRMCTLRFRKVSHEQLVIDFQEISSQYPNSLRCFSQTHNITRLADDVLKFIDKAHHIWTFTYFAVPPRWIAKRKEQIEESRRNRGPVRRDGFAAVPWMLPEVKNQYGLIEDQARFRIQNRIYSRSKKLIDFEFGKSPEDVRESCVFLHDHVKHNKKTALQKYEPFYRGAPCDFSNSHHPRLPSYPIRLTNSSACAACVKLWPKTVAQFAKHTKPRIKINQSGPLPRSRSSASSLITPDRRPRIARLPEVDSSDDEADDHKRQESNKKQQEQQLQPPLTTKQAESLQQSEGSPLVMYQMDFPQTDSQPSKRVLVGMFSDGTLAHVKTDSEGEEEVLEDAEEVEESNRELESKEFEADFGMDSNSNPSEREERGEEEDQAEEEEEMEVEEEREEQEGDGESDTSGKGESVEVGEEDDEEMEDVSMEEEEEEGDEDEDERESEVNNPVFHTAAAGSMSVAQDKLWELIRVSRESNQRPRHAQQQNFLDNSSKMEISET